MTKPAFELVGERADEPVPAMQSAQEKAAIQMLQIGLAALSKKAVVALSTIFTGAALFSAWWLWAAILPNPSTLQLVGVGMYAAFLLALEFVRRR